MSAIYIPIFKSYYFTIWKTKCTAYNESKYGTVFITNMYSNWYAI